MIIFTPMRQPPEGVTTYPSELGVYWFDGEGILHSQSNATQRTLENTGRNFELVRRISGGKKVCHVARVAFSKKPDLATRDFVTRELPSVYKAMAMLSTSGVGILIMTVLFKLKKPPIPIKTFRSEAKALAWIKQYV